MTQVVKVAGMLLLVGAVLLAANVLSVTARAGETQTAVKTWNEYSATVAPADEVNDLGPAPPVVPAPIPPMVLQPIDPGPSFGTGGRPITALVVHPTAIGPIEPGPGIEPVAPISEIPGVLPVFETI